MAPWFVLLHAVERLHAAGFEQVRAWPYVYALGTWRCELTIGGSVARWPDDAFLRYSSAGEWNFLGDGAVRRTPDELAVGLRDRLPEGVEPMPSPAYRSWFAFLLEECGEHRTPVLFEEYHHYANEGYVALISDGAGQEDGRFPLPPT